MPKERRQPARDAKATSKESFKNAPVKGKGSAPAEIPADTPDRPRTRAWLRAQQFPAATEATQGLSRQGITSSASVPAQKTRKNIPVQPTPEEVDPNEARSSRRRARAVQHPADSTRATLQTEGKKRDSRVSKALSQGPRQSPESQVPQNPELSSWLDKVQPLLLEDAQVSSIAQSLSISASSDESAGSMQSSSSVSGSSNINVILSNGASTPKGSGEGSRMKKLIFEKLRTRRAVPDVSTDDKMTQQLKLKFGIQKPISIPFRDTKTLQEILAKFLQRCERARPREDSYADIEELSNEINKWKPTVNLNTITNQDFNHDREHCETSNEAVFQRTVMISIIDRCQLNNEFDFNCEGHWSLQGTYPLPSTQGPNDKVTGPKPDLAIFFRLDALTGRDTSSFSAPVPPKLKSCIWPDGYSRRCFPFVFIEAKKGFHDLTFAVYANMHSASQALFNIYKWMVKAHKQQLFFDRVRLFSIAINAEKLIARVHRAKPLENNDNDNDNDEEKDLVFLYDDLCTLYRYTRDDASLLIRNILIQYGVKELHSVLKDTFEEVSNQVTRNIYRDDEPLKRKNGPIADATTKRARNYSRTDSLVPSVASREVDPSSSFGASHITLNDD